MKTKNVLFFAGAALAGALIGIFAERHFGKGLFETSQRAGISYSVPPKYDAALPYRFANHVAGAEQTTDFTLAAEKSVNAVVHVKTMREGQVVRYVDPFDFFWGGDTGNTARRRRWEPAQA